ncbi:hypothetical protein Q8A67_018995 [Cirrhinus molitorella]|uniref:Uncharacterized protein n=1 Tax=Cirrhinus molitorella TaxID=172907 RepID=A0AA88TGM4_9TELE|nr:hypothetical protein Q8A67_018995 [Cirrhinus molitorella]
MDFSRPVPSKTAVNNAAVQQKMAEEQSAITSHHLERDPAQNSAQTSRNQTDEERSAIKTALSRGETASPVVRRETETEKTQTSRICCCIIRNSSASGRADPVKTDPGTAPSDLRRPVCSGG